MINRITTGAQLAERALDAARNYKTLYIAGCFGAPMNATNKKRYSNNHAYNRKPDRTQMILAASEDTFGFDCVCFIKGLLWGWCGDRSKEYGGAVYQSNGVPDIGEDVMISRCSMVSTDFGGIVPGEAVWMPGHIGIYVGDGLVVECTPAWSNNVQITAVLNIGSKAGYNGRRWVKHGRLPYVTYDLQGGSAGSAPAAPIPVKPDPAKPVTPASGDGAKKIYTVQRGDSLWKIAARFLGNGSRYPEIKALNGLSGDTIYPGQILRLPEA